MTKYCKCETWPRCLHEGIEYQTAPLGYTDQYLKATEAAIYRGEPLGQVSILLGPNLSNHFMLIPGEVIELRDFLTEVIDRRQQFVDAGCPPLGGITFDNATVPSIASGINPAIRGAAAEPKALEVKSPPSPSPQGEDWRGGATAAASRELDQLDRAKEGVWYI